MKLSGCVYSTVTSYMSKDFGFSVHDPFKSIKNVKHVCKICEPLRVSKIIKIKYLQKSKSCRKILNSSRSENIHCSTFPLESHLTSMCKSNNTYSDPISLQNKPNGLDFVGQVFMKFTICVAVLSTAFNSAGRVFAARSSL